MRVTLVNPPFVYTEYDRDTSGPVAPGSSTTTFPVGLAALGSVLRARGVDVRGLDMPYATYERNLELLVAQEPDVVGMSCWTGTQRTLLRLAADLKARLPRAKVVFGGHHATMYWEQLLRHYPQVDAVILGEGEETLPVLLEAWERGTEPAGRPGIAYRRDGEIACTGPAVRVRDLDRFPLPAYDLFHLARGDGREQRFGARPVPGKEWKAQVLAARGCPFQCTFCVDGKFYTQTACRSAKHVVDEIELLYHEYDVGLFEFTDMTFTLSQKRTLELCAEILSRGLTISWQAMTRVNTVGDDVLRAMKEAGCFSISFGVETGSPELLKRIKKGITREQIVEAFRRAQAAGLSTTMLLMVGNPGETEATIADTIGLLYDARPAEIDPSIYQLYPGSQTYSELRAAGFISDDYWLDHDAAPYYVGEHDIKTLQTWQRKLMYHHQCWPRDLPKKVGAWFARLVPRPAHA